MTTTQPIINAREARVVALSRDRAQRKARHHETGRDLLPRTQVRGDDEDATAMRSCICQNAVIGFRDVERSEVTGGHGVCGLPEICAEIAEHGAHDGVALRFGQLRKNELHIFVRDAAFLTQDEIRQCAEGATDDAKKSSRRNPHENKANANANDDEEVLCALRGGPRLAEPRVGRDDALAQGAPPSGLSEARITSS